MVQAVTQQTRQQALRQQQQLQNRLQQLQRQQRKLVNPTFLRTAPRRLRAERIDQSRSIARASSQLREQSQKLEQISQLPTVNQLRRKFQEQIRVARKFANNPRAPLAAIADSDTRELAVKIREGINQRQLVNEFVKDLRVQGLEPIFRQGQLKGATGQGRSIDFAKLPQRLQTDIPEADRIEELRSPDFSERVSIQLQRAKRQFEEGELPGAVRSAAGALVGEPLVTASSEIVRSRPAKAISRTARQRVPGIAKVQNLISSLGDTERKTLTESIGTGLFFEPAFLAGTAGTSTRQKSFTEIAEEQLSGLKNQFDDAFRFSAKSETGRVNRARLQRTLEEALSRAKDQRQVDLVKKLAERLGGKRGVNFLNKIIRDRSVVVEPLVKVRRTQPAPAELRGAGSTVGGTAATSETQRIADLPTIVGGSGATRSSFTGAGQFERTSEVLANVPANFGKGSVLVQNTLKRVAAGEAQLPLSLQRSSQSVLQKSSQLLSQPQRLDQPSALRQPQRLGQPSRTAQRQRFRQSLATRLLQRTAQRQRPKPSFPRPRPRPRFPLRTPFPLPGEILSKRVRTPISGKIPKFDVFTRKKGKFIRINKKPLSRSDALDFGAHHVDTTLRASFFPRVSTRSGLGKIKPSIKGSFRKNQPELRPARSKALRGAFVEKRKFRLDSRSEVSDIKRAKRVAKPKLKSVSMLGKNGKKR